ncbi:MAG TPA: FAD-dependent oxidoreductase [Chloroflexota bacterium]|nr:FAD-dependent oxidoreductase [Chloroflexota bacterium]
MNGRSQTVVVGGGIAGASIAYHLALLGHRDVLVLDQGEPAGGTTSHAPGLVGQLRSSAGLTRLLMYSASLYRNLSSEGTPGFTPVGSLRLASSAERLAELQRQAGFCRSVGLEAHLLTGSEALRLFPLLAGDGLAGALFVPGDGSARATVLARVLIDRSERMGVRFLPYSRVTAIERTGGRVTSVWTPGGPIETEAVVVAAGVWSREIALRAGVRLPLAPVQHQYVATRPIPGLQGSHVPNVRDPDRLVYARQDGEALVVGGYERDCRLFSPEAGGGHPRSTVLPFDAERFAPLWHAATECIPALEAAGVDREVNGLEAFTPDGEFLLGPSSEVSGLWFACGFCAHGVSGAGGVGKTIAEWMAHGAPELDVWHLDIRRFAPQCSSARYVQSRIREVYATYYEIAHPLRERRSARGLRCSALYETLQRQGAVFGEKAGWERPNWFTTNEDDQPLTVVPRGWGARHWSSAIASEHRATRERAGLFDVSSFSKLEIEGDGALPFLQRLAANQLDRPVGAVTYTQLLNQRGGIECDLTITRRAETGFLLVTGTAFGPHDFGWIRDHAPRDGSVTVRDVTSSLCCVGVWGPRSRDILQEVCEAHFDNESFPYLTAREIDFGAVPVLALRVTYVGELGWELYAPAECGRQLWQTLWEAGTARGAVPAGYRAIDSLRLEKGYRYWSADITPEDTPHEAGLGFAVCLQKADFNGRAAILRRRAEGARRKLCCLVLDDPTAWVLGGEAVAVGNGVIGRVTSGGYGYTVEKSIAYTYLPIEHSRPGSRVDVLWFGESIPATVTREPLYDPANARIMGVSTAQSTAPAHGPITDGGLS